MSWQHGLVRDTSDHPAPCEESSRANFFRDLDQCHKMEVDALAEVDAITISQVTYRHRVERAQRQLQLTLIDDIARSDDLSLRKPEQILTTYCRQEWLAMNIPEDAETSYRLGAVAALDRAIQGLSSSPTSACRSVLEEIETEHDAQLKKSHELQQQRSQWSHAFAA
jgi:hypothetical protein